MFLFSSHIFYAFNKRSYLSFPEGQVPVRSLRCVPHGICRPAEQARQSLSSLSKLSLEDFRNVEQSANAARNAQKAKYQGMLSLYLNMIYQILKKYKPAFEELAK